MRFLLILSVLALSHTVAAWDGETEDGESITVESYDHQGTGEGPVEWTDEDGDEHSGYLDMYPGGTGTITDDDTGEEIEVDME